MKDSLIDIQNTGICTLDINKAVKLWNNNCCLHRWYHNNDFKLIEYTPKRRKRRLKIEISKQQAEELISKLKLRCIPSEIFNACTYMWVEIGGII